LLPLHEPVAKQKFYRGGIVLSPFAKVWLMLAATSFLSACGGSSDRDLAQDVCELEQRCYPDEFNEDFSSLQQCVDLTVQDFEDIDRVASRSCARAMRSLAACLGDLSCSEYQDYFDEPTPDYPCHRQDDDVRENCFF
jgi:hypothetical protein